MNKTKKILKGILSFTLPCAICFFCFLLVWYQYFQGVPEKSKSALLNDRYDSTTTAMADGDTYTQQFTINGKLSGIGFNFNVADPALDGTFNVRLKNTDTGEQLMDYENILGAISTTSYTCMMLDSPLEEKGTYNLELDVSVHYKTPGVTEEQMLSLKKSTSTAKNFGVLYENGQATEGSLAMLSIYDLVGSLPVKYYFCTAVFASLACGILGLMYAFIEKKKRISVFFTLLTVSFMYQAVLPTHSAPDETTHYNTAYRMSNRWLGIEDTDKKSTLKRETDNKYTLRDYNTSAYTYKYIAQHIGDNADVNSGNNLEVSEGSVISGYKLPYYLSAAMITMCRLLNIGGVATTFLARVPNTIIYCLLITLAWYIAPRAKAGFLAAAMLPISIHIGTSMSYDNLIISLSFLLIALCMNCALTEDTLSNKKLAGLAAVCILLAPLKSIYIFLPFLLLIVPDSRFESKKTARIFKTAVLVLSVLHFSRYNLWLVKKISKQTRAAAAAPASAQAAKAVETAVKTTKTANFTVGYILSHPGVLIKLVINTFFEKFTYYFETLTGGYLGYLNLAEVKINSLIVTAFTAVTAIAFIPEKTDGKEFRPYQRIISIIISLGVLAAVVGTCILWTPMDYDFIWGFQGRYCMPVVPLVLLALYPDRIQKKDDMTTFFLGILLTLNVFAVLNAFIEIMAR